MKLAVFWATILFGNLMGETLSMLVLGNPFSIFGALSMTLMQALAVGIYVWEFGRFGDDLKPIGTPQGGPGND